MQHVIIVINTLHFFICSFSIENSSVVARKFLSNVFYYRKPVLIRYSLIKIQTVLKRSRKHVHPHKKSSDVFSSDWGF